MALRHREPLPIPFEDIVQIQERLREDYDTTLWEGPDKKILVGRVPSEVPDFVNDMEHIVDRADFSSVQAADRLLLVAARGVHHVPIEPLRQLMVQRRDFDRQQGGMLRMQLPAGLGHIFYRAPGDPGRHLRLGVRVPHDRVADISDATLEQLVDLLGPRLEKGWEDVHCVYLVAARDDVRIDPAVFARDLVARWQDEDRRRRLQREQEQAEREAARRHEEERRRIVADLEGRYDPSIAYAPIKRAGEPTPTQARPVVDNDAVAESAAPSDVEPTGAAPTRGVDDRSARRDFIEVEPSSRSESRTRSTRTVETRVRTPRAPLVRHTNDLRDPTLAHIRRTVDDLPAPRSQAMTRVESTTRSQAVGPGADERAMATERASFRTTESTTSAAREASPPARDAEMEATGTVSEVGADRAPAPKTGDATLDELAQRLWDSGYDVRVRPRAGDFHLDLAAERTGDYPERVIAVKADRLQPGVADDLLAACRTLDVDVGICLAEAADPEGQRRIVATKVRWLRPLDIRHLDL